MSLLEFIRERTAKASSRRSPRRPALRAAPHPASANPSTETRRRDILADRPALCSRGSPEAPLQRPRASADLRGFRGRGPGLSREALWAAGGQGEPPPNLGAGYHRQRRVCGPEAPRTPQKRGGRRRPPSAAGGQGARRKVRGRLRGTVGAKESMPH